MCLETPGTGIKVKAEVEKVDGGGGSLEAMADSLKTFWLQNESWLYTCRKIKSWVKESEETWGFRL